MAESPECPETEAPKIKIAVIGNSNAAMTVSFARKLAEWPDFTVTNRSIGGTPNVVLLGFLATEVDFNYDFIIVETAVCDFLQRATYSLERSRETLELFVRAIRSVSAAQIIFLTIPTRVALLEPGLHWQESLYREVAERFGIPILDGYRLIRRLIGLPKMEQVHLFCRRAKGLISAFGLPEKLFVSLVWYRNLREAEFPSNAFGIFGFIDDIHFSTPMHSLTGTLLCRFIALSSTRGRDRQPVQADTLRSFVVSAEPEGSHIIVRKSSLMSRKLLVLAQGETARYRCPPGYRAFGLLVNASASSGVLSVCSPAGDTTLDCRFPRQPHDWVGIIVPIVDAVGGGDIEVTSASGGASGPGRAELGELILVNADWRDATPDIVSEASGAFHVEAADWADQIITDAADGGNLMVRGVDAETKPIDNTCLSYATGLLGEADLSHADRARLMVALGMTGGLAEFLDTACAGRIGDAELEGMRAGWRAISAEDSVRPEELLERARGLARSGAVDESDALLAEGMARFITRSDFFVEAAANASRQRNWPEAHKRWSLTRSLFPRFIAGYTGSAWSLREMGRFEEAASMLARAIEIFPDDPAGFVEQAWLAHRRGAWEEATGLWAVLRARFPTIPTGYVGGAVACQALGRFAEADDLAAEGRDRFPRDPGISFEWADMATRRGDWAEAARRWLAVRSVFPQDVRSTLDAARALYESGDPARANALVLETQERFPHDSRLLSGWAEAAEHRANWPAAAERWKAVRDHFPAEKRAYRQGVRALSEAGDLNAAWDLALCAAILFPDETDIVSQAAAVAAMRGDVVGAGQR